MSQQQRQYVKTDEHGVMRVGQTRVLLDGVVYAFLEGDTAESIMRQYPALTLEEVYGALTYYLANRDEVEVYLARQNEAWDAFKRECEQRHGPLLERLRRLRRDQVTRLA